MATRIVTVGSKVGLHARPAAMIAEAAAEYDDEILLGVEGEEPVDAWLALERLLLAVAEPKAKMLAS